MEKEKKRKRKKKTKTNKQTKKTKGALKARLPVAKCINLPTLWSYLAE
jgi:hypothetical protein